MARRKKTARISFFDYIQKLHLDGVSFDFFSKKTGKYVPKWELYWSDFTPEQAHQLFESKERV